MRIPSLPSIILLPMVGLLLGTRPALAQSRPAPPPRAEPEKAELTVRVALPSALSAVRDYGKILFSKDQDKLQNLVNRRKRPTENMVLSFPVTVPRSWIRKLESQK
ncbi:hypothetical protein [Hymenobacter persicinus]|uniref:Uncharacterized protein n=1 Tax=Hymenobacter persicinus TaxID=2025506 RepID=A0A4V1ZA99_9BACT|nr:hypothetical protein [Hymenobacter persicinus]RYU76083.1 hypothetical protein EWM57_19010 [Hymenobacter persicinus]